GELESGAGSVSGDLLTYSFEVTNTGSLTLDGVEVQDELQGLSEISYGDWPGESGVLAPGESVTATADYMLTQADFDAGAVDNTATATGNSPSGEDDPVAEDSHSQPLAYASSVTLEKTGALSDSAASA